MNKKTVTVVLIIFFIVVAVIFGYIVINKKSDNKVQNVEQENIKVNNNLNKDTNVEINNNDNINDIKNNGENVTLNSKIGNEVLECINFSNIYSEKLFEELDKNKISDKFKIMYAFSLISTNSNYSKYIQISEDNTQNYISKDDIFSVVSSIFFDTSNLQHQAIFDNDIYDNNQGKYLIVAKGFASSDFNYIVNVPYKITEYSDYVIVNSYIVYVTRFSDNTENKEYASSDVLYYDKQRKEEIIKTKDSRMYDEQGQISFINEAISNQDIDIDKISKVSFKLNKVDDKYLISEYDNLK